MAKEIIFNADGRNRMKKGIDAAADAIKTTMGAAGRNVYIWKQFGAPDNTNDGYRIAKSINLLDSTESMGAEIIKEVAEKTVKEAGDGTSCASLLTQSIITEGLKHLDKGVNVMNMKRGIDKAIDYIVKELINRSIAIKDEKDLVKIAAISANNDYEIGGFIAKAINEVGKDGVVEVEESKTYETIIEVVDGMKVDGGFVSYHFMNDFKKEQCVLEDAYIWLTDRKFTSSKDLVPLMTKVMQSGKTSLLIVADSIEKDALTFLLANRERMNICAVQSMSDKMVMEDIAILTGGKYLDVSKNIKPENVELNQLGQAKRIIISNTNTTFIDGEGSNEKIKERMSALEAQIENSESDFHKNSLKKRLANLDNGVALIKVGGATETEINEKKDRIDDAVCATKAALEEGYVTGGGATYLDIAINGDKENYDTLEQSEQRGWDTVMGAITEPFTQILKNAAFSDNDISNFVLEIKSKGYGYGVNVKNNQFENLLETGVIDPTKVLRVALENAASAAKLFLTTECVLSEIQTF